MRRIALWLAVVLVFIVPWEDSITVSTLGSVAKLMGMALAALWVAIMLVEGKIRRPHLFHILMLAFFLWNFISLFWSPNTDATIQRMKTYSQIFILMLVYWDIFQTPSNLMAALQAYIFGAYVLIASTINNYINGNVSVTYEGRYSATGVNAVDLTLILMMGLPAAMQLFFEASQNKKGLLPKIVNLAYIPLALFAILLTGSRTSLIAVIPFGLYLAGTRQIKPNRKFWVAVILFISILALIPFIPKNLFARLSTLGSSIETGDIGGRVALWWQAILVYSKHPILGLGGGALDSAIGSAAHNTFISVLAETGAVGFLLFITLLAVVLFQAMNAPNGNGGLWVAVLLTWVIGVNSLSWEFRKLTWLFLNFIIIEGTFTYEQLHTPEAIARNAKKQKRPLHPGEHGIAFEASDGK